MLKKWLREPLLHFLLIGAALFVFYNLQSDDSADDSNNIVISESDIDRLITLWEKKWQRLPTEVELEGSHRSTDPRRGAVPRGTGHGAGPERYDSAASTGTES